MVTKFQKQNIKFYLNCSFKMDIYEYKRVIVEGYKHKIENQTPWESKADSSFWGALEMPGALSVPAL